MAKKTGELTPLMKQYWDIKTLHQDKILLFRMGDFYELFYDDAVKASPLLGITLTQRNKKSDDQTPMCGFPHHAVAGPINKLLAAGLKVALCDQIEDPALAKGLVKRAVTRILTPGMVYDSATLDQTKAHYLCSLDAETISFIDTTTGECFYFKTSKLDEKIKLLDVLPVVEIVVADKTFAWVQALAERFVISEFKTQKNNSQDLLKTYVTELSNQELLQILRPFEEREFEHRLHLSQTTLRHLEVFANNRGEANGSLYQAINRTKTSSGARLLRAWMSFPLRNKKQIENRYDQIHQFREHMLELKKVRETLAIMGDIERRLGKISQPPCHGRDLIALSDAVEAGLQSLHFCERFFNISSPEALKRSSLLAQKIKARINEDAPLSVKQGHVIKKGFSAELDELIEISTNAHSLVARLEQREKDSTGITSLKIRYNNVFGYYIEITNSHKAKAPAHYQRKQTLANAERFCTDELIELEKKVLSAQVKRFDLEFSLFDELRKEILSEATCLLTLASICSELDVISSLAWLSLEESYCRPELTETRHLELVSSRHPVVEQFSRGKFIANTISLKAQECLLITGPNMAGKSTLMRQAALIAMLAQMGSFVPAEKAKLPIYDAIFTRIGASDQLSEGLSTFMVEMTETAQMLQAATQDSLLILDEVGRGTATFDGMCLAQSILEYILNTLGNHVFFATHYHELTDLEKTFAQIKNAHMKVIDHKNATIEFLHILTEGSAGQSYGIKVAELAGLPTAVTVRAESLLQKLETANSEAKKKSEAVLRISNTHKQMSLFDQAEEQRKNALVEDLRNFCIQKSSPLQALNLIATWKVKLN
ncbi:MAG: DNA mismatch repair protein MutS [Bdellovibrionaceae bacterium]|nr:DNA mismatch repair protein MutS [Bdellovibrio sp.]